MFQGSSLGGDTGPVVDLGAGPPVHVDESRRLLDPSQPGADRRECREIVVAAFGDMGVAVERNIGDRELQKWPTWHSHSLFILNEVEMNFIPI